MFKKALLYSRPTKTVKIHSKFSVVSNLQSGRKVNFISFLGMFIVLISVICTGCSGTGKAKETLAEASELMSAETNAPSDPTASPIPTASLVPLLKENMANKSMSPLTGLFIDKETAGKRPFAVVINNFRKAIPQSGIRQADIIYEVLAEGDITRLIAIFLNFDSQKIGPVRSARDYFLDFAFDNDAFFVHHGGSPSGYIAIKTLGINDFDGMALEGVTFWRDKNRLNQPGMYEHSSYTDAEKLKAGTERRGFRAERYEDGDGMLSFYAIPLSPTIGETAKKITVPFSKNYTSVFEYDSESRLYYKFQGTEKHIDEETGDQLAFTNVIVQLTDMYIIPGDEAGRRHVGLVGSGRGYIFTNGRVAPITWEKDSHTAPTKWYDEFGDRLKVNKGKTWICVLDGEPQFE